jgi:hypothetical protein
MQTMFLPDRQHTYGLTRTVTGIALLYSPYLKMETKIASKHQFLRRPHRPAKIPTAVPFACLFYSISILRLSTEYHTIRHSKNIPESFSLYKTSDFHGGDYEKCRLLRYKNPVHTWQETHYVSATEPSRLMLCKIWGFHGGDYEKCRLLRYKNPVHTSQETHYVSATEPSRLMLCKIWGDHGGDYEECRLLGYKKFSSYLTGDTLRLHYRVQPVNAM